MNNRWITQVIFLLALSLAVSSCAPILRDAAFSYSSISIIEISSSLPSHPINVGFDVDDTVLFSSPGYHYGLNNKDGPDNTNKYGKAPLSSKAFWNDMNMEFDKYSIPIKSGRRLIEMHKSRGDNIYFITARFKSPGERLTQLLKRTFGLSINPQVIFTENKSKANPIQKFNISLYYGDSDAEIIQAKKSGIRAIRVLRPLMSNNPNPSNPGKYKERVLQDSGY